MMYQTAQITALSAIHLKTSRIQAKQNVLLVPLELIQNVCLSHWNARSLNSPLQ